MIDPNAPLREMCRWMCISTLVDKAASAGLCGRLPQIAGPLMIGALGVGALDAGTAWRVLSLTRGTGRMQCFVDLATAALDSGFPTRAHETGVSEGRAPCHAIHIEAGEGFGRPPLVSIDIVVVFSDALSEHGAVMRALDMITQATWNNPEMAPVSVRTRTLLAYDGAGDLEAFDAQTDTVVDMSAFGSADEVVRSDELYDRYGAPECDLAWRP